MISIEQQYYNDYLKLLSKYPQLFKRFAPKIKGGAEAGGGGAGGTHPVNVATDVVGLLPNVNLANPVLMTVLADYEATSAESTHTFSFSAVNFNDDSEIILIFDMSISAVDSFIQLQIDGETGADYFKDGRQSRGGTITAIDDNMDNEYTIAENLITNAVARGMFGIVRVGLSKGGAIDSPIIQSNIATEIGQDNSGGYLTVDKNNIASLLLKLSVNNWRIGTRATVYKVART